MAAPDPPHWWFRDSGGMHHGIEGLYRKNRLFFVGRVPLGHPERNSSNKSFKHTPRLAEMLPYLRVTQRPPRGEADNGAGDKELGAIEPQRTMANTHEGNFAAPPDSGPRQ